MSFNFTSDTILENDVVLLRPLKDSDFSWMKDYATQEPEIWKYFTIRVAGTENMQSYILSALKGREEKKEYPFVVFDKRKNKFAGSTRFYDIQLINKTLQLGYTWYGKEFQRTGLNKHCKFLLLDFAFTILNMERVEFRADSTNEKSINAMKSIGCKAEGILRSNVLCENGKRRDSIILSILRDEWYNEVKEDLKAKL